MENSFTMEENKAYLKQNICHIEYVNVKGGLLLFNCLDCNKKYEEGFDKCLAKTFESMYKVCDGDINKFCLVVRKEVYP